MYYYILLSWSKLVLRILLNKYDKWYGHPRDVGVDSNKSTFIWQLQFVDFVQYEVVVYIHFHFSLRFQALHGDAHNIIFVSFF